MAEQLGQVCVLRRVLHLLRRDRGVGVARPTVLVPLAAGGEALA